MHQRIAPWATTAPINSSLPYPIAQWSQLLSFPFQYPLMIWVKALSKSTPTHLPRLQYWSSNWMVGTDRESIKYYFQPLVTVRLNTLPSLAPSSHRCYSAWLINSLRPDSIVPASWGSFVEGWCFVRSRQPMFERLKRNSGTGMMGG